FLYLMKAAALARLSELRLKALDRLAYFSLWPGMDAERLAMREPAEAGTGDRFGRGLAVAIVGAGALFLLAVFYPRLSPSAVGWLGIAALLTTVHFGFSDALTATLRLLGRPVRPLFDRPLATQTLSDFWTRRWNLAYVEMNRRVFLPELRKRMGLRASVFATFLLSGLLHEMAISYPAGGGWGLPMAYFAIQGVAVLAERRLKIRSRIFAWAVVLAPLPLVFHAPFRQGLIVPLFAWLHGLWASQPLAWYLGMLLWALGALQLCVLLASFQVPGRLNWREELPRLSPFNQKLMWTYGAFIVLTIVAFAVLTLTLHESFLRGERAAVGIAVFVTLFWTLRLVTDAFYYKSEDWPQGEDLKAGHALLNALFVFLTLGYGTVAAWGLLLPGR
ncbi:hypothetical protein EON79_12880, partial [bacterium]